MFVLKDPSPWIYIALGLVALLRLPSFGQRVLVFLRDLDDYRVNRPSHAAGAEPATARRAGSSVRPSE